MNKKLFIGIVFGIVLLVAWWLISPLWRTVRLDEDLPGISSMPAINDNLSTMDAATKQEFEKQTEEMKDTVMEKNDEMPPNQNIILARSNMVARAHDVLGEALFVQAGDERFLRFENLNTINGPDLRIYLSSGLNAGDFVDLGPIRATEGNVNYPIPAGTDLTKYKNALIWCRAFSVLFSYAQL